MLTGTGAAPARSAVDPIQIWSWVKANDATGEVFGGQQFVSLFSTAFLRNHQAVQDTAELLASNPYPMSPEAYGRQADAYLQFDALDRLGAITAPTLVVVGEQDLLTPPWIAREVADAIPAHGSRSSEETGPRTWSDRAPRRLQPAGVGLPCRMTRKTENPAQDCPRCMSDPRSCRSLTRVMLESDCGSEFIKFDRHPKRRRGVDREQAVASTQGS